MADDVKSEILAAIGKFDDPNMKVVLLLMHSVVEDIGGRIDKLRADEQGLRVAVLNGHEPVHHLHHEWVSKQIRQEEEDAADAKDSKRKIRDEMIIRVLWVVVVFILGGIALTRQ